jgi:hypothetical protein
LAFVMVMVTVPCLGHCVVGCWPSAIAWNEVDTKTSRDGRLPRLCLFPCKRTAFEKN